MSTNAPAVQTAQSHSPAFIKASDQLSLSLGIERAEMINTVKAQCFRNCKPEDITNAQLAAFISIANDMKVNPLLPGMLYAYPDRGAIIPIMGPDGVYKKLSESSEIDSWTTTVFPEDPALPATHATTVIYRKGREIPITYTAYLLEWRVNSNPNWANRPRHMLGLRSLKQAARQVIHGLPGDEDERVLMNVTGTGEENAMPERSTAPARSAKGVAAAKETAKEKAVTAETTVVPPAKDPEKKPASNVVEGEFTDVKADNAVANEKKAEPAKKEEEHGTAVLSSTPPLLAIEHGKRYTFKDLEVDEITKKTEGVKEPRIEAIVKGAYVGKLFHPGGIGQAAWMKLQRVDVVVEGAALKSGKVAAMVISATPTKADAAEQPGDDIE